MGYLDILKILGLNKVEKEISKKAPEKKYKPSQKSNVETVTDTLDNQETVFDILSSNHDKSLIKSISLVKSNVNCFTVVLNDDYTNSLLKGTILEGYSKSLGIVFQVDKGSYALSIYLNKDIIKEKNITIRDTSILKSGTEVKFDVSDVSIKLKRAKSPANVTVSTNVLKLVSNIGSVVKRLDSKIVKLVNDSKLKLEIESKNNLILSDFNSKRDNIVDYLIDISDISSSKTITNEPNGIICDYTIDSINYNITGTSLSDELCLIFKSLSTAKSRIKNDLPKSEIQVSISNKNVTLSVFVPMIKSINSAMDRKYIGQIHDQIDQMLGRYVINRDGDENDYDDDYDYNF